MSLQTRLSALISAIGADIKQLKAATLGDWVDVDLAGASTFTIPNFPADKKGIEIELDGRMSGTATAYISVQPQGPGTSLNSRNTRKFYFINTVEATGEGVSNDAGTRDVGFVIGLMETNPTDVLCSAILDFARTGVGQSDCVAKKRDTGGDSQIVANDYKGGLITIAQPTSLLVKFNTANAATFTGKLRYRFREKSPADNGTLITRFSNLLDVDLTGNADGKTLRYDAAASKWKAVGGVPPIVTDLPVGGSIPDGKEIYYQAAPGIIWHLRYNAGSIDAYKWEWLGGSPLYHILNEPNGAFTTTTGGEVANYNDLAGTTLGQGPRVVIPQLYGLFEIEFGYAAGWNDAQAYAFQSVMLGPSGDARNAITEMQRRRIENYSGVSGSPQNGSNILYEDLQPGDQVYCRYAQAGGGTARWRGQRYLRVRPLRVRSPLA